MDDSKDLYLLDPIALEEYPELEGIWLYAQEQNQAGYKLALAHLATRLSETLSVVRSLNGKNGDVILAPGDINAAIATHGHGISDVLGLSDTLSGLGVELTQLGDSLSGIGNQVDSALGGLDSLGSDVSDIDSELGSFKAATSDSIGSLESSISIHSGILSDHNSRLDTLDASIAPEGGIIDEYGDRLDTIDASLSSHSGILSDHNSRLDTLDAAIDEPRISSIESDIETNTNFISTHSNRLDTLHGSLTSLQDSHNNLDTTVSELQAFSMPDFFAEPQLTAIGDTTISRAVSGRTMLAFSLTIAGLDPEESVTVIPEKSHDDTDWFPLGDPYEIKQEDLIGGKASIFFAYEQPLIYVRLRWLDGTFVGTPTLDVVTEVK